MTPTTLTPGEAAPVAMHEAPAIEVSGLTKRYGRTVAVDGLTFEVPRGGLCLWVDLGSTEARALADAALNVGIRVIPGPTFALEGGFDHRLRLPFTQPPDALERAVRGLAAAERLLRAELRADAGQAKPRLEDPRRR